MNDELAILGGTPARTKPFPAWPVHGEAEEAALLNALRSGRWGRLDGAQVATFERRFADWLGVRHAVAVANGSVSLRIALMAAGIQAGDEIVLPAYTFVSTASAVVECNATPVFADVRRDTFTLDPAAVERQVTPRTRAIIAVHVGGAPCDMDALMTIARARGLVVIEDAAPAHGTTLHGRHAGALGHLGSFSFQSSKNLTCGEGGVITTDDDALARACRSIQNCGRVEGGAWYEHHVIGGNYRLGEFAGAILNAQLDRLDEQVCRRDANARRLDDALSSISGLAAQVLPRGTTRRAGHLYPLRYDEAAFGLPRARFLQALRAEGIPASAGYVLPLYRQPLFARRAFGPYTGCEGRYDDVFLAETEALCGNEALWIPHEALLGTACDAEDVARALRKIGDRREALVSAFARRDARPGAAHHANDVST
jgi:dTDP-4-amino-4,6-dideoxygalactose transaminase